MSDALREILASFGFDVQTKELKHGESLIHQMTETVGGFAKLAAGAFVVGEIKEWVEGIVHAGHELEVTAIRMGLTTESLQQLRFAAGQTGVASEELDTGLMRLQRSLSGAKDGAGGVGGAFKKLGIDTKDAEGHTRSIDDVLPELADKFAATENASDRTALAMAIFGRGGARLLPLLAKGRDGLEELRHEAEELGGGLSEDAVKAAAELEQEQKKLSFSTLALKSQFAQEFFPILIRFVEGAVKVSREIASWTKNTKALQAVSLGLARTAVVAFVTKLTLALGGLRAILFKTILPFLLLEDLLVFFAGGKSAIGEALDKGFGPGTQDKVRGFFTALKDGNDEALDDMSQAIRAKYGGTWAAVFDATRLGISALLGFNNQSWKDSLAQSLAGWREFFATVVEFGKDNWNALIAHMANGVDDVYDAFVEMFAKIAGLLDKLPGVSGAADAVRDLKSKKRLGNQFVGFGDVQAERAARAGGTLLDQRAAQSMAENGGAGVGRIDWQAIADDLEHVRGVPFAPGTGGAAGTTNHVENHVINNITVAPGESGELPGKISKAATDGTHKGINLRAALETLAPNAG